MLPLRENFRSFRGDSPGCRTLLGWRLDECLTLKASTQLYQSYVPGRYLTCRRLRERSAARTDNFLLSPQRANEPSIAESASSLRILRAHTGASDPRILAESGAPRRFQALVFRFHPNAHAKRRPRSVGSDRGRLDFAPRLTANQLKAPLMTRTKRAALCFAANLLSERRLRRGGGCLVH